MTPVTETRVGARTVLRAPGFRMLWLGQALSAVGDPIFPFAVAFLAIARGDSALGVGLVFGARALATTCVVLVGGVLADRFRRTHVMISADAVRLVALVGIVVTPGEVPPAVLAGLVFVVGLGEATFRPAYSALVPALVRPEETQAAYALTSLSVRVAAFAGPALAGVLVSTISARGALVVDAVTFAASIATLLAVREPPGAARPADNTRRSFLADVSDGFRAVAGRRWIAVEVAVGAVQVTIALGPWLVLLPVVSNDALGGSGAYATLLIAMAGGAVLGAVLGSRAKPARPGVVASLCLVPFTFSLIGIAAHWPLAVLVVLNVVAGAGTEIYGILWTTAVQRGVAPEVLGRVFAIDQLGSLALLPIGMVVTGALANAGTVTPILVVAAAVNLVTSVAPLVIPEVRTFGDRR